MSEQQDVHAVLLALPGDTLLLPNAVIAEVVSLDRLRKVSGGPEWLVGTLPYQDRTLRVIRFEVLNGGKDDAQTSRRSRVAILHGMTGRLPSGQYAVMCQGHPNLVTLTAEALKPQPLAPEDKPELALSRVRIANATAVIPNLELIESELAKLDERG